MAIYHLSAQVIGRSTGRSAVAAAAYRAGEELRDERTGLVHDYTKRRDIEAWIQAPEGAPDWAVERERLWNEVEAAEGRKDSQVAREINVALPVELDPGRQDELVRGYVGEQFVERGMVADVAVHRQDPQSPHAHVLLTTRGIDGDGFGPKERQWNRNEELVAWRESWSTHANRELERAGCGERVDHRSHAERGLGREPTVHEGPDVREMEARGIRTERGSYNRGVEARNAERAREGATSRDPVERRAEAWRGLGYSRETSRALAERERDRGKEYGTDGEARDELGREREALYRDRWALRRERVAHGELEDHARRAREASEAIAGSSAWRRALSGEARGEYERARRELERSSRELGRAGVDSREELERRGEELGSRQADWETREGARGPSEGAWREIGEAMRGREEAQRRGEMDRGLEFDR